ncbi:class I adenylate-forming enzyme family protein [Microbacterium sp. RD1]|uniref:class I adenylate-forming enzyme family protein n=1 Tax=Microbacterium sp. RD1 TaxID=3457313 RepID=UPI003FA594FC
MTDTSPNVAEVLLGGAPDDAVALVDGDRTHTYGEVRDAVATVAARLREAAPASGTTVGLSAPNGLFWVAAYLGAMQAGLPVVPLPVGIPPAEAAARLHWAGASIAMVAPNASRTLGAQESSEFVVLTPDALTERVVRWRDRPVADVQPDDDAAYLFTSGTTGTPRAVRLTHRNIVANTASILGYLDLRADDRALVVLPFSYVFGASLLHTHLRAGACLVLHGSTAYPETVVNALDDHRCTVFAGVPSVFHTLLRNSSFPRRALPHLRMVQQAGGRLPRPLLRELTEAHPGARLHVMYGQTEATARLSALDPDELSRRPGSIGRGIPGVRLRVMDDQGADVAPGEVGEIRAWGENVSPGYLHDAEATARKMPGGELHTGDLATVDEDGYIFVIDRSEDFVKSWGHRIASQDVEAAAMEIRDLVAAAAVGVPDAAAGERVALAVVVRRGAHVSEDDVIARCRALLPRYAVPATVLMVDELPLNANGKVVKREIRSWVLGREGVDDDRAG